DLTVTGVQTCALPISVRRNVSRFGRLCRRNKNGQIMTGPIEEGLPYPLGAHWSGKGTNFALFSANATKVEVCLFDGERETRIARSEERRVGKECRARW